MLRYGLYPITGVPFPHNIETFLNIAAFSVEMGRFTTMLYIMYEDYTVQYNNTYLVRRELEYHMFMYITSLMTDIDILSLQINANLNMSYER